MSRYGFDADVLIYAASPDHPLGPSIARLLDEAPPGTPSGVGSVLLIPEVLTKPARDGRREELATLSALLTRLDLRPVDQATAELATGLGATYRLRAADAIHLATAIEAGATQFVTNNRKDFGATIGEIEIVFADELPPAR